MLQGISLYKVFSAVFYEIFLKKHLNSSARESKLNLFILLTGEAFKVGNATEFVAIAPEKYFVWSLADALLQVSDTLDLVGSWTAFNKMVPDGDTTK